MIKSFIHKGLEDFYWFGNKKGIQAKHSNKIGLILDLLDEADNISVMNFPGSGLHLLEPKQNKIWSVKVSGNWRITFKFDSGNAYIINYIDYH